MASRFILPLADVGNGISPSDGAKLTFFITGTSTLKDTFSDQFGTPNTNPVIADGDGLFPEIWIDGSYKVRLDNKSNVPQWEEDPVISESTVANSDARYSAVFGSVASMLTLTTVDGTTYVPVSGQSVYLTSYYTSIPFTEPQGGGGHFRVMTLAEYALTPDEIGAAFTIGGFAFVRDITGDNVSVLAFGVKRDCTLSTGAGTDDGPAFAAARAAVGETGVIFAPDGNYKITEANRIITTNASGPLLGRIVGESRGGTLFCGVGFTGTTPVIEFEPTISSTSDHGCGGLENATIISAPFVAENPGSGLRLTGAQGGFYRNIAIRGWQKGLWLYNDDNTDHYTEMNDFEHFYIHQCKIDVDFSLELGGSANTSFNGTRMKHMNVNAYDGQTILNFGNFALLYHSQLQFNTFAVTGDVTLINANSDSIIRESVIIDFYNEVASGATAVPKMFISGTADARWNGVFGQIGNVTYIPTVLPEGAFANTWPSIDTGEIKGELFTTDLGLPANIVALDTIDLFETPANGSVAGILTVKAVAGAGASTAYYTICAFGGGASIASIAPDKKVDVAGGHAFTLAEVKDGGGSGVNRFTMTNDNAAQQTNMDLNFISFNDLPTFLW
jgi:hypothetical protein